MGMTEFTSRLNAAHENISHGEPLLNAALNDFMRALHEVFVKSERSQAELLHQVKAVLDDKSVVHLKRIIDSEVDPEALSWREYNCHLNYLIGKISRERGVEFHLCRKLFSHLLAALDETRCDADGNCDSRIVMAFWGIGHEAAYHLGGLYVGDDGMMASEELMRLDSSLKRFRYWIDLWEFEMAWEREQRG